MGGVRLDPEMLFNMMGSGMGGGTGAPFGFSAGGAHGNPFVNIGGQQRRGPQGFPPGFPF
jgi:DnaJ family protein C protein 7